MLKLLVLVFAGAVLLAEGVLSQCEDGDVRLGARDAEGYVEICLNNTWGFLCGEGWKNSEASVVCQQLGFSQYGAIGTYFTVTRDNVHAVHFNCTGDEMSLLTCSNSKGQTCNNSLAFVGCQGKELEYASSNCTDGSTRLVGGSMDYKGRLEICVNRMWGTVCSKHSSYYYDPSLWERNAKVVCRQIGHQDLGAVIYLSDGGPYHRGRDPIFVYNLRCRGTETNILECPISYFVGSYCSHDNDVAIECEAKCVNGTVRLVSESSSYFRNYGVVEVCVNEVWSSLCSGRDDNLASVICNQLGYSRYGAITSNNHYISRSWPSAVSVIRCTGHEDKVLDCDIHLNTTCQTRRNVLLVCQSGNLNESNCSSGDLRLTESVSSHYGKLEICFNRAWGGVCQESWTIRSADVSCRQLGFQEHYGHRVVISNEDLLERIIFIFTSSCRGSESSLVSCNLYLYPHYYRYYYRNMNSYCNNVVLNCTPPCTDGDIQLYGSTSRAGLIQICVNGTWGKVCGGEQDNYFPSVVCSQLGFSPYGASAGAGLWQDRINVYHMNMPVCQRNAKSIWECNYSSRNNHTNSCRRPSEGTSVICLRDVPDDARSNCTDGNVRISGKSSYMGGLEICRANVWGSICSSGFTRNDANVACRIFGYQPLGSRTFTISSTVLNPPLFSTFRCSLNDFSFNECNNPSGLSTSIISCGLSVVGIECFAPCENKQIRLKDGKSFGRVEVCISQQWNAICGDRYWDDVDAGVVCKQLGFSRHGAVAFTRNDYISSADLLLQVFQGLRCNGTEENVFDCSILEVDTSCPRSLNAYAICQDIDILLSNCSTGDVRLVGGATPNEGRIEICTNGIWASICSSRFGRSEANVVCSQLGYHNSGSIRTSAYYGMGSGPILTVSCQRQDSFLQDCIDKSFRNVESCNHGNDVGVECEVDCVHGALRLAGSSVSHQGRVEVCQNNTWKTICSNFWGINETMVICRQLGYSANDSRVVSYSLRDSTPIHMYSFSCTGEEKSILNCSKTNSNSQICYRSAGVVCGAKICSREEEGVVRLEDGSFKYEGRVEICNGGKWGTIRVCSTYYYYYSYPSWSSEAMVVCRQLGFKTSGAVSTFIRLYGTFHLTNLNSFRCNGNENNITTCRHSTLQQNYCPRSAYASVRCRVPCTSGQVRLTSGGNSNYQYGRVEMCSNGTWTKVCGSHWYNNEASVTCSSLGFSPYGAIPTSESSSSSDHLIVNCTESEPSLFSCLISRSISRYTCSSAAVVYCKAFVQPTNCSDYSVRLDPRSGGKVLICLNRVWEAINFYGIRAIDAEVLCHHLGYQEEGYDINSISLSPVEVLIVSRLNCNRGQNISQCSLQYSYQTSQRRQAATLKCGEFCKSGNVRLPQNRREGTVEICINGTWGIICNDHWDNKDASVVCRQLGFSPHGAIAIPGVYYSSNQHAYLNHLNCNGFEDNISNCLFTFGDRGICYRKAAVSCQPLGVKYSNCSTGELRIRNETDKHIGRLEICENHMWFSLRWNSYYWSSLTAGTACATLGQTAADSPSFQIRYSDQVYIPLFPYYIRCSSISDNLSSSCAKIYRSIGRISSISLVGLNCVSPDTVCPTEVRIRSRNTQFKNMGRVEVCVNGSWFFVCDSVWEDNDASLICNQLGYSSDGAVALSGYSYYNRYTTMIHLMECLGNKSSILDCHYTISNRQCLNGLADIVCQENPVKSNCIDNNVRLVGGPTPLEGTVEICRNKVWIGICSRSQNSAFANVVCYQLGYQSSGSTAVANNFYGQGTSLPYISIACNSGETNLTQCNYSPCGYGHVGVQCIDLCEDSSVRLVGSSASDGRVEICLNLTWTTICDEFWDYKDAMVACRQLGFSPYGALPTENRHGEYQLSFGITRIHCNGSEENISSCSHSKVRLSRCSANGDASVVCQDKTTIPSNCTHGSVRLVGGLKLHEGRVEVCVNSVWFGVCSTNRDRFLGDVVCKQLGFLYQVQVRGLTYSLNNHGPFIRSSFRCSGYEKSLLDCYQNYFYYYYYYYYYYFYYYDSNIIYTCPRHLGVSVTCEVSCTNGDIRLQGSSLEGIGRVEVCVNETWGSLCSRSWSYMDSSVVCKQLGYSTYGALAMTKEFIDTSRSTSILGIICSGQESSIWECPSNETESRLCSQREDASVMCQSGDVQYSNCSHGSIRLVGGSSENEGRLEVCYGHYWGTVCSSRYWNLRLASVICRQLGFLSSGATIFNGNSYGQHNQTILLGNVACNGRESGLLDCSWYSGRNAMCNHEFGVRCQKLCTEGEVRIGGSTTQLYGQVTVCVNGTWGQVCSDHWSNTNAKVVCQQLGYSLYGSVASDDFVASSNSRAHVTNVNCTGNENSLLQCDVKYLMSGGINYCSANAGVICQAEAMFDDCEDGDVRLVGSVREYEGRVEVCINNAWGNICHNGWDASDGNVVCGQLGFQKFGSIRQNSAHYENGHHSILFGNMQCIGNESSLLECNRNDRSFGICTESRVAAIKCEELCSDGTIRIVGGPSELIGRAEVCVNTTWTFVCGDGWSDLNALVFCRQLGHSPYGAIAGKGGFPVPDLRMSHMKNVSCTGSEKSLFQCSYSIVSSSCSPENVAGIICQVSSVTFSNCTHGSIRLTRVKKTFSGRVEICMYGIWGAVCDDGWDQADANVACSQLGYLPFGAIPQYEQSYGENSKPPLVSDLSCIGSEDNILSCQRNILGISHCKAYEIAGVKCLGSTPVTLSKRVGSLLGGESVIVTGISIDENDQITCKFGENVVDGLYVNENKALCVSPPAKKESTVAFVIEITRSGQKSMGGSIYRYISPDDVQDYVKVQTNRNLVWIPGEKAIISWNPSSLAVENLATSNEIRVDISLWAYNEKMERFEERITVASNLPNTGNASLILSDSVNNDLPLLTNNLHLLMARLGVKVSTVTSSRSKRLLFVPGLILFTVRNFFILKRITNVAMRLNCEEWADKSAPFPVRSVPPCPCTTSDAEKDNRFVLEDSPSWLREFFHPNSKSCYRQANVRAFSPGQQCCYGSSGNIITGSNGGTADLIAPTNIKTTIKHFEVDVLPWFYCCSFLAGPFRACNRYISRRPVDDCSEWPERPPPARMFGDPHIITLDGFQYTFNGKGEFILIEAVEQQFVLQGRMTEPLHLPNSSSLGTAFTALAVKLGRNPTIQLEVENDTILVFADGERIDFAGLPEQQTENVTILNKGNQTIVVRIVPGVSLEASNRNGILTNILITLPEDFSTKGLLGHFNGDPSDDLSPRNSTLPLHTNATAQDIYHQFGLTWMVNDPLKSLFTYGPSGDWDSFHDIDFIPAFEPSFSSPELEQQANQICGSNKLCIFDIAATGDVSIGSSTIESVVEQEILRETFVQKICLPPCVHGACVSNNTCDCSDGYEGPLCDREVSMDCTNNMCENGAHCKVLAGDYICECLPEYVGAFCENEVEEADSTTAQPPAGIPVVTIMSSSIVLAVASVITILVILVVCCVKNKKPSSKTQNVDEVELKINS